MNIEDLQKTKFYPVDMDARTIFLDPKTRERDVAWTYKGQHGIIGMRGAHLRTHPMYRREFTIVRKAA